MSHLTFSHTMPLKNEEERRTFLEQFKLLLDSVNQLNSARETANSFWISINGALTATLAYIRDSNSMNWREKPFLLLTVLIFGVILTFSWLSSLRAIKQNVDMKNRMIIELEKFLPVQIFSTSFQKPDTVGQGSTLAFKEMFVPLSFMVGYFVFGALLLLSPRIVIAP